MQADACNSVTMPPREPFTLLKLRARNEAAVVRSSRETQPSPVTYRFAPKSAATDEVESARPSVANSCSRRIRTSLLQQRHVTPRSTSDTSLAAASDTSLRSSATACMAVAWVPVKRFQASPIAPGQGTSRRAGKRPRQVLPPAEAHNPMARVVYASRPPAAIIRASELLPKTQNRKNPGCVT